MGTTVRAIRESDYEKVTSVVNEWWGAGTWLGCFPASSSGTSGTRASEDRELIAFLIGFVSQSREGEAYIHFVGVRPDRRKEGIGRHL